MMPAGMKAADRHKQIREFIADNPGITGEELAALTDLKWRSLRRIMPLIDGITHEDVGRYGLRRYYLAAGKDVGWRIVKRDRPVFTEIRLPLFHAIQFKSLGILDEIKPEKRKLYKRAIGSAYD